jgi:propionyl-CoA synthetase
MTSGYRQTYDQWRADPQAFWAEAAREIAWIRPPERIFDPESGVYGRWFPDARCNACYNALDRHVEAGWGDEAALHYDSPVASTKRTISYRDLLDETATLGAVLHELGVAAGDRVLIYMPMIPEAVVAMLACARIGAVHSVVFGGFAAKELATRIDDAEPKVVLTASCGIEPGRIVEYKPLLDLAIGLARRKPASCVVYQRPQVAAPIDETRDHDWKTLVGAAEAAGKRAPCADLKATDPLYILYTSGTTGAPKGVLRDIGGYIVALKWTMSAIYGVKPGETYWTASDIGWVVGHSYIVYAPLLHGCASVLYEGKPIGTPDAGAFWRVIQDYKVAAFFTAPTAFRAVRKEDPQGSLIKGYDIKSLRTLFLAGERADPDTVAWAQRVLGVPVSTTGGRPRPGGRSPPIRWA